MILKSEPGEKKTKKKKKTSTVLFIMCCWVLVPLPSAIVLYRSSIPDFILLFLSSDYTPSFGFFPFFLFPSLFSLFPFGGSPLAFRSLLAAGGNPID